MYRPPVESEYFIQFQQLLPAPGAVTHSTKYMQRWSSIYSLVYVLVQPVFVVLAALGLGPLPHRLLAQLHVVI